jgi:hypothetical protein
LIGVKVAGQFTGVPFPNGKKSRHTYAREVPFAIGAEVFEENVTEGDLLNAIL